jgi:DNA-binding CsgD family transcriptional regulator
MHAEVLVLKNAHLIYGTDVELTKLHLKIIWLLANNHTNGMMVPKLNLSIDTINHHIYQLYEITGAHGQGGLVAFGYNEKFLIPNNGDALKGWENNNVVVWEWRKRKYGEKK